MKFVIDDKIPYIKGVLEPYADVSYIPGALISPDNIKNADGLVVRTRTRCNKTLLEGSSVKFIATATIGFDHIDTNFCQEAGIAWTNAPGCNSESVNQYIASALTHWSDEKNIALKGKTIGIIGVGNVGSKVARTAEILGMKVLLNDPPRARVEGLDEFVVLDQILQEADIISLHVPLNLSGIDKTYHLAGNNFIRFWKNPELLINTCRGEVMETSGIKNGLEKKYLKNCIIDCWENEPNIDLDLLKLCLIATPHIAGYSRDGKANGTSQSIQSLSRFFGLGIDDWYPEKIESPHIPTIIIDGSGLNQEQIIQTAVQSTYAINHDDQNLRANPANFEKLRGDYPVRREFNAFEISCSNIHQDTIKKLKELGFNIKQ